MVQLMNQERANQMIAPLALDQHLTQAACKHAELMVAHQALSHQFDGEPTLAVRFADAGLHSNQQAENVGFNQDIYSADEGFMHSPEHRASILNASYDVVGVCVIARGDHVYVTEDFAHRLKEYSEPEAEAAFEQAVETYAAAHKIPKPVRRPQPGLSRMACAMALNDSLQSQGAKDIPGVQGTAAWTTSTPGDLPSGAKELLSHRMSSGYSLGACFAPSVSNPGGIYWVVMTVY